MHKSPLLSKELEWSPKEEDEDDQNAKAVLVNRLRGQLDDIAIQQDSLAQSRQDTLVARSKCKSSGKRVRQQRERLGQLEATLMDRFREHYNALENNQSPDLVAAYTAVEDARNELALLEDEHNRIDKQLDASEWALMEAENDLYQFELQQLLVDEPLDTIQESFHTELLPPKSPVTPIKASPKILYQIALNDYDECVQHYNSLRPRHTHTKQGEETEHSVETADLSDNHELCEMYEPFSKAITRMMDCEVRVRKLRSELMPEKGPVISQLGPRSVGGTAVVTQADEAPSVPRAHSDGAFRHIPKDLPNKHCVDHWLLETLKSSNVEKLRLKMYLQHELEIAHVTTFDYTSWWSRATQLWPSSMVDVLKWPGLATSLSHSSPPITPNHMMRSEPGSVKESSNENDLLSGQGKSAATMTTGPQDGELSTPPITTQSSIPIATLENDKANESEHSQIQEEKASTRLHHPLDRFSEAAGNDESTPGRGEQPSATSALDIPVPISKRCDSVQDLIMNKPSRLIPLCSASEAQDVSPSEAVKQSLNDLLQDDVSGDKRLCMGSGEPFATDMGHLTVFAPADHKSTPPPNCLGLLHCEAAGYSEQQNVQDTTPLTSTELSSSGETKSDERSARSIFTTKPLRTNTMSDTGRSDLATTAPGAMTLTRHARAHRSLSNSEHTNLEQCVEMGSGFCRISEPMYRDFFTTGRVFSMILIQTTMRRFSDESFSSRESSPVGHNRESNTQRRFFVVVKNRLNFSDCLPVILYRGHIHIAIGGVLQDFGEFAEREPPLISILHSPYNPPAPDITMPHERYGRFEASIHPFSPMITRREHSYCTW